MFGDKAHLSCSKKSCHQICFNQSNIMLIQIQLAVHSNGGTNSQPMGAFAAAGKSQFQGIRWVHTSSPLANPPHRTWCRRPPNLPRNPPTPQRFRHRSCMSTFPVTFRSKKYFFFMTYAASDNQKLARVIFIGWLKYS